MVVSTAANQLKICSSLQAPKYFRDLIPWSQPNSLWFDNKCLVVPSSKQVTYYGGHAFSTATPRLWMHYWIIYTVVILCAIYLCLIKIHAQHTYILNYVSTSQYSNVISKSLYLKSLTFSCYSHLYMCSSFIANMWWYFFTAFNVFLGFFAHCKVRLNITERAL